MISQAISSTLKFKHLLFYFSFGNNKQRNRKKCTQTNRPDFSNYVTKFRFTVGTVCLIIRFMQWSTAMFTFAHFVFSSIHNSCFPLNSSSID